MINSASKTLIQLFGIVLMISCTSHTKITFPEDGIYRYIIFEDYDTGYYEEEYGAYVSRVYVYNLELDDDEAISKLSDFAQYFHCLKNNTRLDKYIKGTVYVLSDPNDFSLAPRYYDDVDWGKVETKSTISLVTKYDSLLNDVHTEIRRKESTEEFSATSDCEKIQRDMTMFERLDEEWWEDVEDVAKKAWDAYGN